MARHQINCDMQPSARETPNTMRITVLRDKLAAHHREAKSQRDLYRAISKAPTPSSRQELLNLR